MKDSSHWYDAQGNPCHTQKCGPKAKNPYRPTTIRDARKLGLFPSVTTILDILAKPQLDRWKFRQITDWSVNNPPAPDGSEDKDLYFNRALEGAFQQVQDAADAGSRIHAILEDVSNGKNYDKNEWLLLPEFGEVRAEVVVEPVIAFFQEYVEEVLGVEKRLVNHSVGFAGTADLLCKLKNGSLACIDFKTRKTTPGKPCEPYDTQPMQIAAYAVTAFGRDTLPQTSVIEGCNLFISTTEPGRTVPNWYDHDQLFMEFEAFTHICKAWQFIKQYDPTEGPAI